MNKFEQIIDIKERQAAFLQDTIDFYNSNNRAELINDLTTFCYYTPTRNSPGCAIGRHLDRDNPIIINKWNGSVFSEKRIEDNLPKWMKDMGMIFLQDIQALHDNPMNWDANGLSDYGKNYVNHVKFRNLIP